MHLFKLKSSKNNLNNTAAAMTRNVASAAQAQPAVVSTTADASAAKKRPGRKPPPDLLVEISAVSASTPPAVASSTLPAPVSLVPQRVQIAQKGMSIDAFNDYMDEVERSQGLSKVGVIRINQHTAALKEPLLLDYGMSDVEFLRMMYQCMKLRDSVDIHSTKSEKGAAVATTFLSMAPTLTYNRVHANKVTRRMWAAEPLIAKYLAETVNPDLRRRGVPLVWSTRPSEGDGVQLCLNVIEDPTKPNRGVLPFKKNTEASPDIPGMEKRYPIVNDIHFYSQCISNDVLDMYNLKMKHTIYMSSDSSFFSYNEALWGKIGMPREKLCGILDDIFECVSHHRANPTESSLLKLSKIGLKIISTKDQRKKQILQNKATVIAQVQARPEIIRIVDHYNQDMVNHNIPVRFIAIDFREPNDGIKKGIGGNNLGIYVPGEVFSDEDDCIHRHLVLKY